MLAVAVLLLAALASTMTYTGYLVVGVLSDYLGIGRAMTGLLLGGLFARVPWISEGKLRTVGLLPKRARRPIVVSLLALCLLNFLYHQEMVHALFSGFTTTFLLAYPSMRKAALGRMFTSLFKFPAEPSHPKSAHDTVIDVEFREKKD